MKPIKVKEARRVGEPRLAASASSEAIPRVSARQRSQGAAGQTQTTVSGRIKGKSSDAAPTRVVRANEPASQFEESADFKAAVNPNNLGKAKVPRARRMQLSLTRVEPWSVAKVSFLLAIAGGIIQVIAACLLWVLLNTIGLFDNITQMVSKTGLDAGGLDLSSVLSLGTVISSVTIFSIFEIVLVVVLATIGAFLYNVVGSLVGGIHVTLGDD
nr:DUF3566 domain-containing protein [Bombiscardovia apis]